MNIANDFNSIKTHLEDDYKALENLGVSVENRNIENIKDMANQIYAKFPKTDFAEGSNITLSNTLKGKLDFENDIVGYGQTEQDSTKGYNLFNPTETWSNFNGITTTITNQIMKWNGTVTTNGSKKVANISMPSGTYTISLKTISGSHILGKNIWLDFLNGTTKIGGTNFWQDSNKQVTFEGDVNIVNFGFDSGDVFNNYSFIVMIESGTTAHDYEPYTNGASPNPSYSQDIEVVRGTQTVYIKDENNNIIDTKTINLGEYEFAKIGNYVDTIEYDVENDKVYKNEKIGKVNLKDISWTYDELVKRIYGAIGNGFIPQASVSELAYLVCTHYSVKLFDTFYSDTTQTGIANGNGSANISLRNANYTSLAQYTTEFTNNTEIAYYAKTPQDIEITGTLKDQIKALYKAMSFTGTTIIEIDGDLPLVIKVRALKG